MLIFLIVILLLAALLEGLSLRGGTSCVDADFTLSKTRTEPDEPVELTLSVGNLSRLPITYCTVRCGFPLSVSLPEGLSVHRDLYLCTVSELFRLWGRQRAVRTLPFSVGRRGVHTISGREINRGDFLGLRVETGRCATRRVLMVYPRRLESSALLEALGSYCGELTARRWLLRDPVLAMGVREYTGNEPMHTISWNQTARRGELTVREFDYTRSLNCCVLLSVSGLTGDDADLLDRCCGAARTVCEALLANGVEARLFTNAALIGFPNAACRSVSAAPNREEDLLDVLARVTSAACSEAPQLAEECLNAQSEAAAYVLIAPRADAQTDAALRVLNARSVMGALLVAVEGLEAD